MTNPNHGESQVLRRRRLKVPIACQTCRSLKAKCDGRRPACTRCQTQGRTCNYTKISDVVSTERKRAGKSSHKQAPVPAASLPSPSRGTASLATSTPATIEPSHSPQKGHTYDGEGRDDQCHAYCTAHGRFTDQVTAAIDERTGILPHTSSHPVPLVDAPLFGELDLPSPSRMPALSMELPPRARADQLAEIYWRHIDPAEPVLDQKQFYEVVEAAYAEPSRVVHNREIWLSILNLVFAQAVQRQESIPLEARNGEGTRYFLRAWALLPAESILWQPGSLELVQCLMLINRYLHCTNNQQKTWMTAGLALRIAQNMCPHPGEGASGGKAAGGDNKRTRRKVWASCVDLDRCVSWSLGRTSAWMLTSLPGTDHLQPWLQELHEIGNQIQIAQATTGNSLASRSASSCLGRQEEYQAAAIHLDGCLNKWESRLAADWQPQNIKLVKDRTARMERYILHLRVLHARIYLYRPMLAEFYSMKVGPRSTTQPKQPSGFGERLLKEYAGMCVEVAQRITSTIAEIMASTDPEEPRIGILAWWSRIYYLHIAGVVFLAAMVGAELFTDSVARSWQDVLGGLRAHTHLSAYVQQCICTFETLAARMLLQQTPTAAIAISTSDSQPLQDGDGDEPSPIVGAGLCNPDAVLFQDIRFDFDDFLFGTEDGIDFGALY